MSDITLGIIGSGQLGSLLCQAAKKLNVKTVVISDDEQGPAQNYSNEFIFLLKIAKRSSSKFHNTFKNFLFIHSCRCSLLSYTNLSCQLLRSFGSSLYSFIKNWLYTITRH